jgi:hypothetical protein
MAVDFAKLLKDRQQPAPPAGKVVFHGPHIGVWFEARIPADLPWELAGAIPDCPGLRIVKSFGMPWPGGPKETFQAPEIELADRRTSAYVKVDYKAHRRAKREILGYVPGTATAVNEICETENHPCRWQMRNYISLVKRGMLKRATPEQIAEQVALEASAAEAAYAVALGLRMKALATTYAETGSLGCLSDDCQCDKCQRELLAIQRKHGLVKPITRRKR